MGPLFLGVISLSWVYIGNIDLYMRFTLYKVTFNFFLAYGTLPHAYRTLQRGDRTLLDSRIAQITHIKTYPP